MGELAPILFAHLFGNCNRFLFRNSYVKCFLSKNVHINDGFSSERHLKICSINFCRFFVCTLCSSVLLRSTSNCILKSLCKILKVTVNVFWVKISISRLFHILLAELSRHTMIPCLKPTEVLKMEEISCKRRLLQFLNQSFLFVVFKIHT